MSNLFSEHLHAIWFKLDLGELFMLIIRVNYSQSVQSVIKLLSNKGVIV